MFQEGNSGTVCRMYERQPNVNSEAAVRSFELQCRGKVLASIMNNRGTEWDPRRDLNAQRRGWKTWWLDHLSVRLILVSRLISNAWRHLEQKLEMLLSILPHRTNLLRTYPAPKPIMFYSEAWVMDILTILIMRLYLLNHSSLRLNAE